MSTTTHEQDEVLLQSGEGILTITINRPQARNAVTLAVARGIAAAIDELDAREDLRIGILTGAGGSFCAGMDLKGFLRGERPSIEGRGFGGLTMRPPKKPLIAAVEGYALAGGFELVLACDLVVAADNAQFGVPEVKRGLAATGGGLLRLPRQLPYRVALELALTGDMFPAARAYHHGLINQLTEPGQALAGARELAQRIVANGPLAVAASKRVIIESQGWPADELWSRQAALTEHVFNSEDAREGSAAFAQKRAPVWQGK
ncbi:crotonase/enoyl-CoA hydratase family protein [Bordetella hinzii]|uniref:Enoyl-CoA hydratase n=1 Tax=Bordetella hinzii TaxID=103855 RepID=A0AAN1RTE5_9BORD|nr:crotonase/enoyl-CoA hydratase family protein [Bordetella hinzii]AKQ54958.1 Carnitinyl-CoA dehydratase [Bordetella hinzii]AKQ59469.1 Carnitinyl-CoA dehydratase [Bordetella hinzii]AZW15300.1 enoyl-CoA hydratase [Bordetella hinzii]KCB30547.1 enoyl-CoA hydratase/isomerase family protein [Bordetella hinzii L60]KCB32742.1 enoyl-CoA hydratase/isomerase family protein [Bordetella hinzii CA90 BAL1384]